MEFLVQRTRRPGRPPKYALSLQLMCTPEELALIHEHRFDKRPLYAVPEQQSDRDEAINAFERSDTRSVFNGAGARNLLTDVTRGMFHLLRSQLQYTVTVADAIAGTDILCPDLLEMLECERLITEAFDELDRHLADAQTFDLNREQILVPDGTEDNDLTPPHRWANPFQRLR